MRYSPPLYSIVIHEDAEDDLDEIYEMDEEAGADIDVFLDEAAADQTVLENLNKMAMLSMATQTMMLKNGLK